MIIDPASVEPNTGSAYPEVFHDRLQGRIKRKIGNALGLQNFGVNWVTLEPGGSSALRHWHEQQDEFVYVISGEVTLVMDDGKSILAAGMMAGFAAGQPNGHHLVNDSNRPATYLEIGDRTMPERVHYPDDDLQGICQGGRWQFARKTGEKYEA